MQLWYAPTSPFSRKVRIAAHELGVAQSIELTEVNPWTDDRLRRFNPLGKVPTLLRDEGPALYESALICEYLDSLSGVQRLFPASGEARWQALLLQGLGDGISAAGGRLFADEQRRPDERSERTMQRCRDAIESGLAALERAAPGLSEETPAIGEIAVAAGLGYLEFRWPERSGWTRYPTISRWFLSFRERPSMIQTVHRLMGDAV